MGSDPTFTLAVVTSSDGFIARAPGHAPSEWASPEEQKLFRAEVAAADWSIMGRGTHEAADRPERRRIIFSSQAERQWRRSDQIWINPNEHTPWDLPALVNHRHVLQQGLILGGTRVHDWFLHHQAISRVILTVEPVLFGKGLPMFSDQARGGPSTEILDRGFVQVSDRLLNEAGTMLRIFEPSSKKSWYLL